MKILNKIIEKWWRSDTLVLNNLDWSFPWLIVIHYELTIIGFHGALPLKGCTVLASQHLWITQLCQESANEMTVFSGPFIICTVPTARAEAWIGFTWIPEREIVRLCRLANWNCREWWLGWTLLRQYYFGSKALTSVNTHIDRR